MAFPAGLTMVTVHGRFDLPPSGGAAGAVRITSRTVLTGPTDNSIVPPFSRSADLDANGEFTLQLPATNDPQWAPVGWAYAVQVSIGAATIRGTLQLDYQSTAVELADLLQVDGAAVPGTTYATLAALAQKLDLTGGAISGALSVAGTLSVGGVDFATALAAKVDTAQLGAVRPTDHGFGGWTFPPDQVQSGTVLATAGLSYVVRIRAMASTVTNICIHLTAAGVTLTAGQCFASLHNDAGAILGAGAVTADQAAAWATGGFKTMPLTVAQGVTPGAWYRARLWFNGTTGPSLSRAGNSSSAIVNAGLSAANSRFSTADAGLTTAGSAPGTIGTQTGGPTAWWVAVS